MKLINKKGVAWVTYDGEVTDSWSIAENWELFEHEVKELTAVQYETYISACRYMGLSVFRDGVIKIV